MSLVQESLWKPLAVRLPVDEKLAMIGKAKSPAVEDDENMEMVLDPWNDEVNETVID